MRWNIKVHAKDIHFSNKKYDLLIKTVIYGFIILKPVSLKLCHTEKTFIRLFDTDKQRVLDVIVLLFKVVLLFFGGLAFLAACAL